MQSVYHNLPAANDRLCFNCEQIFTNRRFLEEHHCPVPTFICSCGSEFATYHDMLQHSKTHEPGYQVVCHETIKKQRIEKHGEEEEKLKRLLSGEVVWETPKALPVKAIPQKPVAPKIPQVKVKPPVPPRVTVTTATPAPPATKATTATTNVRQNVPVLDNSKVYSNIGAPTVDLWTLFQPVVVVKSTQSSSKTHVYTCGKCGQTFATRRSLVIHHNNHIADKVLGCIGCGLLLSSRKIVPRFHSCNSPNESKINRFKLITARPINQITLANGLGQLPFSSQSLKIQNNFAAKKISKDVDYNPSPAKKPHIPVQAKSIVSNAKLPVVNTPPATQTAPAAVSQTPGKGFECRVCHVYFESINVLQRHKCAKAHEFLLKHKLATPVNRQRQVVPLKVSTAFLQNNVNKTQSSGPTGSTNIKKTQAAGPTGNTNIKNNVSQENNKESAAVVSDDDCFIVESGPEKPAEVIYQVTSSVPIKT